ncbi:MAG: cobyrinate a,c-diamide synthase [Magnetococcales bacterium]|nr:cobyrinate a,c-diamide synthase [Magnetococcales bacterium]
MKKNLAMNVAPGVIIAAAQSRSGKTTLTMALLARLQRDNIPLAPFKAGPDYLDGAWHSLFSKQPCYNLDTFMVGPQECRTLFQHKRGAALGIIEGVMGLYDGLNGVGGPGSTAHLAQTLGLPVLLVVNVRGMAGSLIPLVQGFVSAAQGFTIVGILANQAGGQQHVERLSQWLDEYGLPPIVGWMGRENQLVLQERHLGLTPPDASTLPSLGGLADALHLNQALFDAHFQPLPAITEIPLRPLQPLLSGKTIAVAQDQAFSFIYPANVECLHQMGARVHFFSPLAGDPLPDPCDAIWLPGGYPELYGQTLSTSPSLKQVHHFGQQGGVILAECGGMMALGDHIVDIDGRSWPMTGLLPITTIMTPRLAGLGYRRESSGVRGHEFHHSIRHPSTLPAAFTVDRGDPGVRWANVLASYVHWFFPSAPEVVSQWFGGGNSVR